MSRSESPPDRSNDRLLALCWYWNVETRPGKRRVFIFKAAGPRLQREIEQQDRPVSMRKLERISIRKVRSDGLFLAKAACDVRTRGISYDSFRASALLVVKTNVLRKNGRAGFTKVLDLPYKFVLGVGPLAGPWVRIQSFHQSLQRHFSWRLPAGLCWRSLFRS